MTTQKTEKFAWTDENKAQAISLYTAMLENPEQGAAFANGDGLVEIGEAIGQHSVQSIRGKLSAAGVYKPADKVRKVGGGSSLRKAHFIRAFAKVAIDSGFIEDEDEIASLESAKLETLGVIAKMLDIYDDVKAEAEK